MAAPKRAVWKAALLKEDEGSTQPPEEQGPAVQTSPQVKEEPEDDEQDGQPCTVHAKEQIAKRMRATPKSVKKAGTKKELSKSAKEKAKAREKENKIKAKAKAKGAKEKAKAKAKANKQKLKISKKLFAQRKLSRSAKKEVGALAKAKKEPAASKVRVKREPGTSVKVKLEPGASAKKAPPGRAATSKGVLAAVKKEPGGLSRDPKEHFRHQVGFIEQVISGPWDKCFGALGTGIVGACQRGIAAFDPVEGAEQDAEADEVVGDTVGGSSSSSRSAPARGETEEAEQEGSEAEEGVGDTVGGSSSSSRSAPAHGKRLSIDAVIVLFKNAPTCNLQVRNGKTMGGYTGGLDVEAQTLAWSSQRRDVHSRYLNAIVDHVRREGRVLVAVRPPTSYSRGADSEYRMLGQVTRIDGVREAENLVQEGDTVLQEQGTTTVHKAILPTCLNASLRAGVGLTTVSYDSSYYRRCKSCCFSPPQAVLHFDELEPAGVSAYLLEKGSKLEQTEGSHQCTDRPMKRIRKGKAPDAEIPVAPMAVAVKQEPGEVAVKREPSEP